MRTSDLAPDQLRARIDELQERLAALHRENEELAEVYRGCPIGIAVLDEQCRFVRVDDRFAAFTGTAQEQHAGRPVKEILPGLAPFAEDLVASVLNTHRSTLGVEISIGSVAQPGRLSRWVSSWLPLRNSGGEVVAVSLAVEDVTAQREAEERFRISQEVMPDGFLILRAQRDAAGTVEDFVWEYANPAAMEIIDATGEDLVGQRFLERLPGSRDHDQMFPRYVKTLESGETSTVELTYDAEGISGWFRTAVARIDAERIAIAFRDITARKRAEQELLASQRQLSAVLDNTKMAVILMDEHQHCAFMNKAAEELTGYRFEETKGRSLHEVIHHTHPDGRPYPLQECPIDRAFPERHQTEGEEVFVHRDGHFYPVAFTASPILEEGAAVGTVVEVRDITGEKADRERLQMLIDELNHRVKNTLATVQSIFVQSMRSSDDLDVVRESAMSRILALSRSHDLLTERHWSGAGFRDLAERSLAPFLDEPSRKRFVILGDGFDLRPKPALAIAMALHELATNAVKHGALRGDAGHVELRSEILEGDRLRITWQEVGGPEVKPPERSGFGRRLIERGLAYDLQGKVRMSFDPAGLRCEIEAPASLMLSHSAEERGLHG